MKEVRRIIPNAQLIQTEDIGRVFSTPLLQYQTDYENERRWLALDILVGRVDRSHPFHQRLLDHGIEERHLAELADDPCPPDIIGIDHYLTSDRFLDDCWDGIRGKSLAAMATTTMLTSLPCVQACRNKRVVSCHACAKLGRGTGCRLPLPKFTTVAPGKSSCAG